MRVCGGEVDDQKMCGEVQKNMCVMEKFTSTLNWDTSNSFFCANTRQKCMCLLVREIKQMFKDLPMKVNAYEKKGKFGRSGVTNREVRA